MRQREKVMPGEGRGETRIQDLKKKSFSCRKIIRVEVKYPPSINLNYSEVYITTHEMIQSKVGKFHKASLVSLPRTIEL